MKLAVGTRVRLIRDVERFPHFIAREGLTGVVVLSDDDLFAVRMDEHLDGAEEWNNEVVWQDETGIAEVAEEVEPV